jgi:hypothetical protein
MIKEEREEIIVNKKKRFIRTIFREGIFSYATVWSIAESLGETISG